MANKVIAIIDINSDHNQYIETLLFANILEQKYDSVTVMDLNPYDKTNSFFNVDKCKEKDGICTLKIFDRCNYIFPTFEALTALKMNNLAKVLADKNDILLINSSQLKFDYNTYFYDKASEIVVFADAKQNLNKDFMNFFITHALHKKKIKIFIYNYVDNLQQQKAYLSLVKQFKSDYVQIETIKEIDKYNSLNKIINIDPWDDIYKKINGAF